jgi:hypothetical protein
MTTPPAPPPGPELDAEVGRLLRLEPRIRWSAKRSRDRLLEGSWYEDSCADCRDLCITWINRHGLQLTHAPVRIEVWLPISTDPGAAFRALETWRGQKMGCWLMAAAPSAETGGYWHCELHVTIMPDEDEISQASAATFPHAAALALRAALGGGNADVCESTPDSRLYKLERDFIDVPTWDVGAGS